MDFNAFAIKILLFTSSLLGVSEFPQYGIENWRTNGQWHYSEKIKMWQIEMVNSDLPKACRAAPESLVKFPMIIQGGYELYVDEKPIGVFGNTDFAKSKGYYGAPEIDCKILAQGESLRVLAYSYLRYYARFSYLPHLIESKSLSNFFSKNMEFVVGVCLLLLGLFSFFIFFGKVDNKLAFSLLVSNISLSFYFLFSAVDFFPTTLDSYTVHKYGLTALWVGVIFLFRSFSFEKVLSKNVFKLYSYIAIIGIVLTLLGTSADSVQLGTHFAFGPTLCILTYALVNIFIQKRNEMLKRKDYLQILSMIFFIICSSNDMLMVVGILKTAPLFSLGVLGSQYFFSLAVNEKIIQTYEERDYLRINLEKEVIKKTDELRTAQAELIQSAKLVSLGTLSAGLAHEINNSINYVNGALLPLQKIILESNLSEQNQTKIEKLLKVMKDGLGLTIDIIKNLKSFSGINQAPSKEISIEETLNAVLTLLRNRLKDGVDVTVNVNKAIKVYGSVVGLNQIFMNLITNALDAMPKGGRLTIDVTEDEKSVCISIADSGSGIPEDMRARIFDPFFTTKEVGKGTGLGLHIVKKEISRIGGEIKFVSSLNKGTTFYVTLPKTEKAERVA